VGDFIVKNPTARINQAAKSKTKPTTIIVVAAPIRSKVEPTLSRFCLDALASMLNVNLNNTPEASKNRNITTQATNVPKMPTTLTTGCAKKITAKKSKAANTITAIIVPITPQKNPNSAVRYIAYELYSSEKPLIEIKIRINPIMPTMPTEPENNDNDPTAASSEPTPQIILYKLKPRISLKYI